MNTSIFTNPMTDGIPAAPLRATSSPAQRLRRALRVNATTSLTSGFVMALAADWVDDLLGTGHPGWVRLVGLGVALFGIDVLLLSRSSQDQLRRWAPAIVVADTIWVVASVVTILLGWYSTGGAVAVAAMAIAVDTFAVLQWREWRRLTTH